MGKKRKKKIYTTLKKIKHKHVNKSLNIINSINNPMCLSCNNRVAVHFDRFTCTCCGVSYLKKDINGELI